ncbi:MAG: flagellar basal body L-ring protein FlgH, partial [Nitrospirota bacterium]
MLFEYTVKLLLLAGFLELVLYRLVSRLGMHLSKVAEKYESVRITFKALSSIGFTLLNFVSLLVFLAIFLLLPFTIKLRGEDFGQSQSLFTDVKARKVGDILTVLIFEQSRGTSQAETKTDKSTSFSTDGGPGIGSLN